MIADDSADGRTGYTPSTQSEPKPMTSRNTLSICHKQGDHRTGSAASAITILETRPHLVTEALLPHRAKLKLSE